ncbi:MAG: Fur family transcriptional regulator [Nitrospira sp.]|nr:Fur family transcriptional regulator [Nitrospira sp.]MCY3954594.1 Fur family transcriptional regulator [Nitrospira sp.]MCY4133008.1 Fur family transcriptional regulator [Nitrospira sp.]
MVKPTKELEILKQHLSKNGLKLTRQRENILATFLKMEHVTAEQMYRLLSRKDPHIGLATVYRTLKLLCETGLAQEQHFGSQTQFDNVAHKGHHDHLICTVCDKIIEFENCQIEELQDEVARTNGFTIRTHKLELYGTPMQLPNGDCKNCGKDLENLSRTGRR